MDASPSTSDTSYMSIDLDSSILHQVQKAIHRYDLSTCTDCLMFDLHVPHAKVVYVYIYRYILHYQHSCIIPLLIDLQQPLNRSLRMMKKYPYPRA